MQGGRLGKVLVAAVVAATPVLAATTAGAAPVRPTAQVAPPTATPEEVAERWVRAAIVDLLGRPATDQEVATLAGRRLGGTSRGVIAKELARSPQWVGAVVTDLYQHILGRDPETAGLAYWVERIQHGDRVASVAVSIYGAPEYYAGAGGGTDGGFVDALYESILDRAAESSGREYWVGRLEGRQVAVGPGPFACSCRAEARGRRVQALYDTLLGRPASASDREYWAARLVREDDIVLAAHLVGSAEYEARAQQRDDTVGDQLDPGAPVTIATQRLDDHVPTPSWASSGDAGTVVLHRDGYLTADLVAVERRHR